MTTDEKYMSMALRLAEKGRGNVNPNPMVGAVIVKNNAIIGRGWHKQAGKPHAEIEAIRNAGTNLTSGASLYVTLEPCSSYGKTPPCVDAIIKARFKEVICGSSDPNPKHNGKGFAILANAGIKIKNGVLEEKCKLINETFFKWIKTGMPFVTLKLAMTLDGKIADSEGNSKWISSEKTRLLVQKMRFSSDAILIGANTAIKDRPSLTVRNFKKEKQPLRLVAASSANGKKIRESLSSQGGEIRIIKASSKEQWIKTFRKLASENITSILVEGGGILAASLLSFGLIDKIALHYAPIILGGKKDLLSFAGENRCLADAFKLGNLQITRSENDIILSGYPK